MDLYRACVAAHLLLGIVLAGQALFWLTMLAALRQRFDAAETDRLLGVVKGARWPHVAVPYKFRLPLPWVGWLTIVALAVTGVAVTRLRGGLPAGPLWTVKQGLIVGIVLLQALLTWRPSAAAIRANFYLVLISMVVSAWMIRGAGISLYHLCIALHLLALSLWLGHMFVWSLIVGPALKKLQPPATAELLRERSMFRGGLGWYALAVLVPTGLYLLHLRGIDPAQLLSAATYAGAQGHVIAIKLGCVAGMIVYQTVFAHRSAPIAIYFNMLLALGILCMSVLLVRGAV